MERRCPSCHKLRAVRLFPRWLGQRQAPCWPCIKAHRRRKRQQKLRRLLKPFPVVTAAYALTSDEQHAVDLAAGQALIFSRWRNRHSAGKWSGPTAEQIIDAETSDIGRRQELLAATSLRKREIEHAR